VKEDDQNTEYVRNIAGNSFIPHKSDKDPIIFGDIDGSENNASYENYEEEQNIVPKKNMIGARKKTE
jgi:hypothetical protein